MLKPAKLFLMTLLPFLSLTSCNNQNVDGDKVVFSSKTLVQRSFGGLGVEWGAYEDTEKLIEGGWERVIKHMDHLEAARIRLMISYDWFCQEFDNKGTADKNDDTWVYNFTNKYAANMIEILEYCQIHNIDVAFGAWNVIGSLGDDDVWGMMDEVTSDIRWAKITADTLDFLVNKKGFTCIKWFVSSNEPNYKGAKGSSKNYNNTYEIWEQGVKNVRKALDDVGLTQIGIVGGDTTGFEGSEEYLINIAKNIKDKVGDYGYHLYLSNIVVDRGDMFDKVSELHQQIRDLDPSFGNSIQANIWEAGLRDGKTALDCQSLIATSSYAVRMTDFTLQALAANVNGITYWDFDDAMHFMYSASSTTPKEWGMFSSLAETSSGMQELRPWYHTSSLLCHLFRKGSRVYNANKIEKTFRSVATVSNDNKLAGFVAVNAGLQPVEKTFRLDEQVEGDKVYVYIFNESSYRLDEDGYIAPNYVIDGSINDEFSVNIPNGTAVFVSNRRL